MANINTSLYLGQSISANIPELAQQIGKCWNASDSAPLSTIGIPDDDKEAQQDLQPRIAKIVKTQLDNDLVVREHDQRGTFFLGNKSEDIFAAKLGIHRMNCDHFARFFARVLGFSDLILPAALGCLVREKMAQSSSSSDSSDDPLQEPTSIPNIEKIYKRETGYFPCSFAPFKKKAVNKPIPPEDAAFLSAFTGIFGLQDLKPDDIMLYRDGKNTKLAVLDPVDFGHDIPEIDFAKIYPEYREVLPSTAIDALKEKARGWNKEQIRQALSDYRFPFSETYESTHQDYYLEETFSGKKSKIKTIGTPTSLTQEQIHGFISRMENLQKCLLQSGDSSASASSMNSSPQDSFSCYTILTATCPTLDELNTIYEVSESPQYKQLKAAVDSGANNPSITLGEIKFEDLKKAVNQIENWARRFRGTPDLIVFNSAGIQAELSAHTPTKLHQAFSYTPVSQLSRSRSLSREELMGASPPPNLMSDASSSSGVISVKPKATNAALTVLIDQ